MGKNHPASRKCKKVSKRWTDENNNYTLHKLRLVPKCTLRSHLKRKATGEEINKAAYRCAFNTAREERLAKCIAVACNYGFSPSMKQIEVSTYMLLILHINSLQ